VNGTVTSYHFGGGSLRIFEKIRGTLILVIMLHLVPRLSHAQELKALAAESLKTTTSFPVRAGRAPLTVRVRIEQDGTIRDSQVFRQGSQTPFQTIPPCQQNKVMRLYPGDEERALVEHADFNFDGFEDLKLLQDFVPHLGKSYFCVYLWDEMSGQFRFEPQIPEPDPIPHPEDKTITTQDVYSGDATYRHALYVWIAGKVTEIARWGVTRNEPTVPGTDPACPWVAYCSKRINGKMQNVSTKEMGCNDIPVEEIACAPPPLRILNATTPPKK